MRPPESSRVLLTALSSSFVFMYPTAVSTAEMERGAQLYQNHCIVCHAEHIRAQHKLSSFAELRRTVVGWTMHARLPWSEEEVNDVTCYLNQLFYHFDGEADLLCADTSASRGDVMALEDIADSLITDRIAQVL